MRGGVGRRYKDGAGLTLSASQSRCTNTPGGAGPVCILGITVLSGRAQLCANTCHPALTWWHKLLTTWGKLHGNLLRLTSVPYLWMKSEWKGITETCTATIAQVERQPEGRTLNFNYTHTHTHTHRHKMYRCISIYLGMTHVNFRILGGRIEVWRKKEAIARLGRIYFIHKTRSLFKKYVFL